MLNFKEYLIELNNGTLKSYMAKSMKDMIERKRQQDIAKRRSQQPRLQGKYGQKSSMRKADAQGAAAEKRAAGIGRAAMKIAKSDKE